LQPKLRTLRNVCLCLLEGLLQALSLNVLHLRLKRTLSFSILNCLPRTTKCPSTCGLTSPLSPSNVSLPLRGLNLKVSHRPLIRRHELLVRRRTCCHAFVQITDARSLLCVSTRLASNVTAKFFCTQAHTPDVSGTTSKRLGFRGHTRCRCAVAGTHGTVTVGCFKGQLLSKSAGAISKSPKHLGFRDHTGSGGPHACAHLAKSLATLNPKPLP
jgi:hypothetical protein